MSETESKFHLEQNVFLTTTDEIDQEELKEYLEDFIEKKHFREGTQFIILCGVHGNKDGSVARYDPLIVPSYASMLEQLKEGHQAAIIEEMNYKMGKIVPIFSLPQDDGKYHILMSISEDAIQREFESLLEKKTPVVLIFASCHSVKSEINKILRSSGLLSVLTLGDERGQISAVYELDTSQKEILQKVAKDHEKPSKNPLTTKNIFIYGSCGSGKTFMVTELSKMRFFFYDNLNLKTGGKIPHLIVTTHNRWA